MINSENKSIRVCVFNAQIADTAEATDSCLQEALQDFSKVNTEVIFVRNTGLSKSQFKKADYIFREIVVGENPILIALKADRFTVLASELHLSTDIHLDGGRVSSVGIKMMLREIETNRVSVVAFVSLSFNFYDLTEEMDKKLLEKLRLRDWLDLNKEARTVKTAGVAFKSPNRDQTSYSSFESSVTYLNIKNRLEVAEKKEKEKNKKLHVEKKHSSLSKLYHKIVDHKHHHPEPEIKIVGQVMHQPAKFNTIICGVSIDQSQGGCHEFDAGERFHNFKQDAPNDDVYHGMTYYGSTLFP